MFYDRLKIACKNANTSVTATLKAIGIGTANGTYWKNGSIPSSDVIVKLAEFLNVSTDYLLLGKEHIPVSQFSEEQELIDNYNSVDIVAKAMIRERARTLAELAAERAAEQSKKATKSVPSSADERPTPQKPLPFPTAPEQEEEKFYVDICSLPASAGTGVYLDDRSTEPLQIVHTNIAERANYAVRVSGDSMEPRFFDGDIVLVETCPSVEEGEIGIFVVDGEGFIKKYGGDRLISLNPKYKDMLLKKYESSFCRGRVLGIAEVVE